MRYFMENGGYDYYWSWDGNKMRTTYVTFEGPVVTEDSIFFDPEDLLNIQEIREVFEIPYWAKNQ